MHCGDLSEEMDPPAYCDWANPTKLMCWTFNTIEESDAIKVSSMWREFIAKKMLKRFRNRMKMM